MMPDQGSGGSIERSRRSLSTSTSRAAGESEACPEAEAQIQEPTHDEELKTTQPSQESPRQCEPAARAAASGPTTLSRQPSHSSSAASTPATESVPEPHNSPFVAPQHRPVEPPVTRATLSELDVSKILHNPKLRHDINFDPELHFRPNLDGEKGRRKQDKANLFWNTLKADLIEFVTDRPSFYEKHGESDDWSLPLLLKAVKDIIQTLVPQRDRQFLEEGLNVELLMQQFHKGIADLEKLASWLSRVLKSHCAPMRDEWVDTMYNQLSTGNRQGDMDMLVTGMRSLLSVLEAMKLDVANHQIRCLRPVLIEDTTHFEQKFFYKKIQSRKLDISAAMQWYREADLRYGGSVGHASQSFGDMGVFFEAVSRLILPSYAKKQLPSTFLFDEERITKLRSDAVDAVNLDICMRMYEDLERLGRFNTLPMFGGQAVDDDASSTMGEFNFNTPPATSRPSSLVFSSAGSQCSSPRSSLVLPSYVAPDQTESKTKARNVYNSLVALMQSAPPAAKQTARWEAMAPSVALQIFRFTNAPSEMLSIFEEKLTANICDMTSNMYQEAEQNFHNRLMTDLGNRVHDFKALSGVALFSVATGGRVQPSSHSGRDRDGDTSLRDAQEEGGIEDMATRLAHLGILHWRVWSQLAYVGDIEHMSLDAAPSQI
ncbi:Protein SOK1 [Paramyrothecium foliicola]|nr:Protein SOK1 [Paramyrothecium foliicola]